jgi:hypothetical protein
VDKSLKLVNDNPESFLNDNKWKTFGWEMNERLVLILLKYNFFSFIFCCFTV